MSDSNARQLIAQVRDFRGSLDNDKYLDVALARELERVLDRPALDPETLTRIRMRALKAERSRSYREKFEWITPGDVLYLLNQKEDMVRNPYTDRERLIDALQHSIDTEMQYDAEDTGRLADAELALLKDQP